MGEAEEELLTHCFLNFKLGQSQLDLFPGFPTCCASGSQIKFPSPAAAWATFPAASCKGWFLLSTQEPTGLGMR